MASMRIKTRALSLIFMGGKRMQNPALRENGLQAF